MTAEEMLGGEGVYAPGDEDEGAFLPLSTNKSS